MPLRNRDIKYGYNEAGMEIFGEVKTIDCRHDIKFANTRTVIPLNSCPGF